MLGTLQVSEGVIKVLKSRPRALGKPKYSGGFRLDSGCLEMGRGCGIS